VVAYQRPLQRDFYQFNFWSFQMGEVRINLSNFVTIGLMAYVAVWAINKGMTKFGYENYKA
jgi:hypothetical protein